MVAAYCPNCDHLQFPPDGSDLAKVECANCHRVGVVSLAAGGLIRDIPRLPNAVEVEFRFPVAMREASDGLWILGPANMGDGHDAPDAPIAAKIRQELEARDQAARDFKPDSLDEFRRRIAANPDLLRP